MRMGYRVTPATCPGCSEPLKVTYADRRAAAMAPHLVAVLIAALLASVVLAPLLFLAAHDWVEQHTGALRVRERRFLATVAAFAGAAVGTVPGYAGWRWAHRHPKRMRMACRYCRWRGLCWLSEDAVLPE